MPKSHQPSRTSTPAFLYLHGFASSPASTKATFFKSRLSELGAEPLVPDLNRPSFEEMTLTSQLKAASDALVGLDYSDLVIFGSSLGGLLATLYARGCTQARALVLLAPGFGLPRRWNDRLGPQGVDHWQSQGYTEVFHHGYNRNSRLRFDFIVDALKYDTDNVKVSVPTLVFHGRHDQTVPVEESIRFAESNPGLVKLHVLDDGHDLIQPLDHMWQITRSFLQEMQLLPASGPRAGRQEYKVS